MIRIVTSLLTCAAFCVVPQASLATPITVPPDLNPGDTYRLVFLTSTRTDARSLDIDDYNAFVSGVANAVPELAALGAAWRAIGSTHTVHARDNSVTNPATTGAPIYRLDGTRIADNNADLWDGSISANIKIDESGSSLAATDVWTGTREDGTIFATLELGSLTFSAARGFSAATNTDWIRQSQAPTRTTAHMYAISKAITVVVPEPGTMTLVSIGVSALAGWRLRSFRRRHRA